MQAAVTTTLVDTHAHLASDSFAGDREEVLVRAADAGVSAILCVSETLAEAEEVLSLCEKHPLLKPAAGLYPEFAGLDAAEALVAFIRNYSAKLHAIGEVGLDYWLAKEDEEREVQREVLRRFIALGRELDLPLNIHSRSAGRHVIELLLENDARKIQLHAFDGKWSAAIPAVEAGFFFSVPPSIIHSRQKQKLVKQLPLSCLLLESDSPVLGPVPRERNEPANIVHSLQAVSDIKNIPLAEVRETVLANTLRLYPGILS
nr:TatD family hydrolase [Desulfoprunum benzoelyticum]